MLITRIRQPLFSDKLSKRFDDTVGDTMRSWFEVMYDSRYNT